MAKHKDTREQQTIHKEDVGHMPDLDQPPIPAKESLPAVVAPPSLLALAAPTDETSGAFMEAMQGEQRAEVPGIPFLRIDHLHHCFTGLVETAVLYGYVVHWFQARAFWKKGYQEGDSNPPDCWSPNMHEPSPASALKQASTCHGCKWSQFGSAMGGTAPGQACKVSTFTFLVNGEFGNPPVACLILPPSSIKPLMGAGRTPGYLQRAKGWRDPETGKQARYYELVWTKFTLEPGGDRHDVLHCEPLAVCRSADEARALAGLRKQFMQAMEAVKGDVVTAATGAE